MVALSRNVLAIFYNNQTTNFYQLDPSYPLICISNEFSVELTSYIEQGKDRSFLFRKLVDNLITKAKIHELSNQEVLQNFKSEIAAITS